MRISVNLATRPFVELRPLFARLRLLMLLLALVAVGLGFWLHALTTRAAAATAQIDALSRQTDHFVQLRAANENRMKQPQNRGVLDRSQFLNALFARKSFSWTAVMMDLERVLPAGVQVTSIDPAITKEGDVQIRLRVTGDRDKTVQLVRNLEFSQRFVAPRLAGESLLTSDKAKALGVLQPVTADLAGTNVEFDILSGYNPLPEPHSKKPVVEAEDAPDIVANPAGVKHNRHPAAEPAAKAPARTGGAK